MVKRHRHRPTEVRALVNLLDAEHDSVEALAQEVLDLLMELKWGRSPYIAIQRHTGPYFTAWGPYATLNEAQRDIGKRIVGYEPDEVAYFCKVHNKDALEGSEPEIWDTE